MTLAVARVRTKLCWIFDSAARVTKYGERLNAKKPSLNRISAAFSFRQFGLPTGHRWKETGKDTGSLGETSLRPRLGVPGKVWGAIRFPGGGGHGFAERDEELMSHCLEKASCNRPVTKVRWLGPLFAQPTFWR